MKKIVFCVICLCFARWFFQKALAQIIISEVYFEWPNERIELTNTDQQDFTWDLTLVWASNNPIYLSGFSLSWLQSMVLVDQWVSWILLSQSLIFSPEALILRDDWAIDLTLLYSWQIVDNFIVNVGLVLPFIDLNNSFEKVRHNGQLVTTVCTGSRSVNMLSWYIANPWTIMTVVDTPLDIEQKISSWWLFSPSLVITEVSFDGTDEWIEITNFSDTNFSGNLLISWVKATPLFFSGFFLASGNSIVLWDSLSMIVDKSVIYASWLWFNISDSQAITISLRSWQDLIDNFFVSSTSVWDLNNKEISFERLPATLSQIVPTSSGRVANVYSPRIANPGFSQLIQSWWQSWQVSSSNCPLPQKFQLSEIHRADSSYPDYLEFKFSSTYTGKISFQFWSYQWQILPWEIFSGDRFLISSSRQNIDKVDKLFIQQDLAIPLSWNYLIQLDDWSTLSWTYSFWTAVWSIYPGLSNCWSDIDTLWQPSPWFHESLLPSPQIITSVAWLWQCQSTPVITIQTGNLSSWKNFEADYLKIKSDYDLLMLALSWSCTKINTNGKLVSAISNKSLNYCPKPPSPPKVPKIKPIKPPKTTNPPKVSSWWISQVQPEIKFEKVFLSYSENWFEQEVFIILETGVQKIDLSSWRYIQIGSKRTYLDWKIQKWISHNLSNSIILPHKDSCLQIKKKYSSFIYDSFCYEFDKSSTGKLIEESELSDSERDFLKLLKRKKVENERCVYYDSKKLSCKSLWKPKSKTVTSSTKKKPSKTAIAKKKKITKTDAELKIYKAYVSAVNSFFYKEWPVLYRDTRYFNYYHSLQLGLKAIRKWEEKLTYFSKNIDSYDLKWIEKTLYNQDSLYYLLHWFFEKTSWNMLKKRYYLYSNWLFRSKKFSWKN